MQIKYLVLVTMLVAAANSFSQTRVLPATLAPDSVEAQQAQAGGYQVFRILPRGVFPDDAGFVRGGGAYFSFAKNSHDYDQTPQLELESSKNFLVGFAGDDYGLITRLGNVSLDKVDNNLEEVKLVLAYHPAKTEEKARSEYRRLDLDPGKAMWSRRANVVVGSTYLLRAINYEKADTVVAFNVLSQGADGGVTIAWKKISDLETPSLRKPRPVVSH